MASTIPAFQDEVKHITAGVTGTVIAIFIKNGVTQFDVRASDEGCIYYNTLATNWEVIRTQEEIEGTTD